MKQITQEEQESLCHSIPRAITNNKDLAALGVTLLMIAASREGETLVESEDFFKFVAVEAHEKIKYRWDQMRRG